MGSIPRLKRGEKLLVATHNAGKLAEFRELFSPLGIVLISAKDLDLPEPEETGTTFAQNARLKAHAAASAAGMVALADDSGLCVEALNGEPGVYTADWAATPNGRDYQHRPQEYEAARDAWIERQTFIIWLRRDLEKHAEAIDALPGR